MAEVATGVQEMTTTQASEVPVAAPNTAPLMLYYYPNTMNSRKVMLALESRKIEYKARLMNVHKGEHLEPWFLNLAPRGELPVMQHGPKIITSFNAMLEYINSNFITDPAEKLFPDVTINGEVAKELEKLQNELEALNIPLITYSTLFHPSYADKPCEEEERLKKIGAIKNAKLRMRDLNNNFPDCSTLYAQKEDRYNAFLQKAQNEDLVKLELKRVGHVLDKAEAVLAARLKEVDAANPQQPAFIGLFNNSVSAADINLLGLINTICRAGMVQRFLGETASRPNTRRYWEAAIAFGPFQKILALNTVVPLKDYDFNLSKPATSPVKGESTVAASVAEPQNKPAEQQEIYIIAAKTNQQALQPQVELVSIQAPAEAVAAAEKAPTCIPEANKEPQTVDAKAEPKMDNNEVAGQGTPVKPDNSEPAGREPTSNKQEVQKTTEADVVETKLEPKENATAPEMVANENAQPEQQAGHQATDEDLKAAELAGTPAVPDANQNIEEASKADKTIADAVPKTNATLKTEEPADKAAVVVANVQAPEVNKMAELPKQAKPEEQTAALDETLAETKAPAEADNEIAPANQDQGAAKPMEQADEAKNVETISEVPSLQIETATGNVDRAAHQAQVLAPEATMTLVQENSTENAGETAVTALETALRSEVKHSKSQEERLKNDNLINNNAVTVDDNGNVETASVKDSNPQTPAEQADQGAKVPSDHGIETPVSGTEIAASEQ